MCEFVIWMMLGGVGGMISALILWVLIGIYAIIGVGLSNLVKKLGR